jgi:hypothetical protein
MFAPHGPLVRRTMDGSTVQTLTVAGYTPPRGLPTMPLVCLPTEVAVPLSFPLPTVERVVFHPNVTNPYLGWDLGVHVNQSRVPCGGMGLFASRPLPAGHQVPFDGGQVFGLEEFRRRRTFSPYAHSVMLATGRMAVYDEWVHRSIASFANDGLHLFDANCEFSFDPARAAVALVLTRPVCPGAELFVSYGAEYWEAHRDADHMAATMERMRSTHAVRRWCGSVMGEVQRLTGEVNALRARVLVN